MITFIVSIPGEVEQASKALADGGSFCGIVKAGENQQIKALCVAPYIRRFMTLRKGKGKNRVVAAGMVPEPFKTDYDYYQPENIAALVTGILEREGWDGETPAHVAIPNILLMAPVFHTAFPDAQWLIVQPEKPDKRVMLFVRAIEALVNNDAVNSSIFNA